MLLIDVDSGRIVEANNTAVDYYGYSYKKLTAMTIQDINILSADETKAEMSLASSEERNYFKFKHELASGEIRNVEVYSYPFEEDGKTMLFSIIHDVTEKTLLANELEDRKKTMYWLGSIFIMLQAAIILILKKSLSANKRIQKELAKSKEKYQSLFDNMQEGFALHEMIQDENGNPKDYIYTETNSAFIKITGVTDPIGKTIKEIIPGIEESWLKKYSGVALTGQPVHFDHYSHDLKKYFRIHAFSSAYGQFASILFDISERMEMEKALEKETERLMATINSLGEGFIATDGKGIIQSINRAAEDISLWSEQDANGKEFEEVFKLYDGDDSLVEIAQVRDTLSSRTAKEKTVNIFLARKDGENVPVAITTSPIIGSKGTVYGTVSVLRDMSEENSYREKIEYMSYHDHLTGLYNRRFFEEETSRLDTARNMPISVIYADVNGLKRINDEFGHGEGDKLLTETARIFREFCRAEDIIARLGGDEFGILLPSTSSEKAKAIVERIMNAIDEVHLDTGPLSVAMGWETKEEEKHSMKEIIKKAENYMYKMKRSDK